MPISKKEELVIEFLLESPVEEVNINQIARKTKQSVGSAFNAVKELEEKKILNSNKKANSIFYNLNLENSVCRKIIELILAGNFEKFLETNKIKPDDIYSLYDFLEDLLYSIIIYDKTFYLIKKENDSKINELLNLLKNLPVFAKLKYEEISKKDFLYIILQKRKENFLRQGIVIFGFHNITSLLYSLFKTINKQKEIEL